MKRPSVDLLYASGVLYVRNAYPGLASPMLCVPVWPLCMRLSMCPYPRGSLLSTSSTGTGCAVASPLFNSGWPWDRRPGLGSQPGVGVSGHGVAGASPSTRRNHARLLPPPRAAGKSDANATPCPLTATTHHTLTTQPHSLHSLGPGRPSPGNRVPVPVTHCCGFVCNIPVYTSFSRRVFDRLISLCGVSGFSFNPMTFFCVSPG